MVWWTCPSCPYLHCTAHCLVNTNTSTRFWAIQLKSLPTVSIFRNIHCFTFSIDQIHVTRAHLYHINRALMRFLDRHPSKLSSSTYSDLYAPQVWGVDFWREELEVHKWRQTDHADRGDRPKHQLPDVLPAFASTSWGTVLNYVEVISITKQRSKYVTLQY